MEAVAEGGEFLVLRTPRGDDSSAVLDSILGILSLHPGDCEVALEAQIDDETIVRIKANTALRVKRSPILDEELRKIGCIVLAEKVARA
jgi:hypothetical protein